MATEPDAAVASSGRTLCLTGPESTGKTTLAETLAERFKAVLVPEMSRDYLSGREDYSSDDVLEIARLQIEAEAQAHASTDGLVICDTDLLVIQLWWEERYGALPDILAHALNSQRERAYLLLSPDIEWKADPLRKNPADGERFFNRFQAMLAAGPHPYRIVSGSGRTREESAVSAVTELFANRI